MIADKAIANMARAIPATHFSTNDLPASDQFDAWRDIISAIFDVGRLGGPNSDSFEARVDAYQISNLVVTDSNQGEQAYSLTPKRIRATGMDLIQIGLYRSGGYRGDANGRSIEGQAGDLQILDLARPMKTVEPASDMVCIFMPRETLQDRIGDLDGLHGASLRDDMGGLLADYLRLLAKRLPRLSGDNGDAAANATLEIISACLRPTAATIREAQAPLQNVVLQRAKQIIEGNLRSPHLNSEFLCGALGISRRSLYRLFEPLNGVHQYVLRRRLSQIRRALKTNAHQGIAVLAEQHGFTCKETFWRAFKRQYGVTPGEVRSASLSRQKDERPSPEPGLGVWLQQLQHG
ncbi:helix-turn-helix domain-containing protein [Bradyrhizobium brasilense]|nr:helix-turn-helix domain-containing protein [Bradyrhizobium brasilense]MCC8969592.1 helix-turn-helix domain-containing protein [Bradyrhizobium brasilense]